MIPEELQRRGVLFDGAVFLANLALVHPLVEFVKRTQGDSPLFGGLLLAAALLQGAGAYFKRRPLHARMAVQNAPAMGGMGYLLFMTLAIMHFAVCAMCVMVGLESLGLKEVPGAAGELIALGCALVASTLSIVALIPPRAPGIPSPALARREWLADGLLWLSTVIILAWWDGFWVEYLAKADRSNIFLSLLLVVLATVPFAIFYLAPRMVLLREDYAQGRTWLRTLIVMLPLAARFFWG